MTSIVIKYDQKKILIFRPLDIFNTHAHEVHFYFIVLNEFKVKKTGDQLLVHCQRDYEFPLEDCCTHLNG